MPKIFHNHHNYPLASAARDDVLAGFDAQILTEWKTFSLEWALRLVAVAESVRGAAAEVAWDVANRVCREARGNEPELWDKLPGWFGPRVRRVIGHYHFHHYQPRWIDHAGVVVVLHQGEKVRCFVSEPYPWAEWDDLPNSPEMAEAKYIAKATGCQLEIHRVAWWNAHCFRITLLPEDHRLPISKAVKKYNPRPLHEVFPDGKREYLFRR